MRMIEKEMVRAINERKPWQKDNTQVSRQLVEGETEADDFEVMNVYLHGHEIASVFNVGTPEEFTTVDLGTLKQWPTRTTMSRLRALGVDVCKRKGVVHLDGKPLED